jgi:hypothetical protein
MAFAECAWSLFHISVGSHNYDHGSRQRQICPNDNQSPQTWVFWLEMPQQNGKWEVGGFECISEGLCDEGKPNVLQSGLKQRSSTLERTIKKPKLSTSLSPFPWYERPRCAHIVSKIPPPSLYKDFSVFVKMASCGLTSSGSRTGSCTSIDHRVRSIKNALQVKH